MGIINLEVIEKSSIIELEVVEKYNTNHDPKTGRFTSAPGGAATGRVSVGGTTKEEDEAYMAAVRSGDMKTAQRMVREKAERMGVEMFDTVETTSYKLRTDAPPTQTVKAYKVFFVDDDGDPSALYVEGKSKLPVGVWLDAQDAWSFEAANGKRYVPSTKNPNSDGSGKTGKSVKIPNDEVREYLLENGYIDKVTTQNVTALAYRPGWHGGDLPFFPQGGKQGNPRYKDNGEPYSSFDPSKPETNYKNIHRRNQVVYEVEFAADQNYTKGHVGTDKKKASYGKFVFEDMQEMPKDGYYEFATNPMTSQNELGKWFISGSMKINRPLTQEECDSILTANGFKTQEWEGGTMSLDKLNVNPSKTDRHKKLPDAVTYDDDGKPIPLSQRMDPNSDDVRKAKSFADVRGQRDGEEAFQIMKSNDDKREVFGWALVAIRKDGEQIVDHQKDVVDPDELEHAAYEYVLKFRDTGELHDQALRKKGKLIESVVLTKEKQAAMGIPEGTVPEGWWVGFKIEDDAAWQGIKSGRYRMFSIEGQGIRQPMDE